MPFGEVSWRRKAAAGLGGLLAGLSFALLLLPENDLPPFLSDCRTLSALRSLLPGAPPRKGAVPNPPRPEASSPTPERVEAFYREDLTRLERALARLSEHSSARARATDSARPREGEALRDAVGAGAFSDLSARASRAGEWTRANDADAPAQAGGDSHASGGASSERVRGQRAGHRRNGGSTHGTDIDDWREVEAVEARADFEGRMAPLPEPLLAALRAPKKAASKPAKKSRPFEFRPPTLKHWLGKDPFDPPTGKLAAPSFAHLRALTPAALPDGTPVRASVPPPAFIERLEPPDAEPAYAAWRAADGGARKPHWHAGKNAAWLHAGAAWGAGREGRWAWLIRKGARWWTPTSGSPRMVRHQDRWWWRTRDGWFVLHDGEPWLRRRFAEWAREGLIHPATGTRIVYSADGLRVAVVTPGEGWAVFDARTGELLAAGQ
ncbi:MAG: hypothetical protein WC969_02875 [Elusimicrobiota bacterium]|jgi:hypothetical protein